MRHEVRLSTYKEAMDYKRVLAVHLLIVLVARPRALVEDARSGRILDLHCRHDGRRHRHDVSHGRPVTKKLSKIVFERSNSGLTDRSSRKRGRCRLARYRLAGHVSPIHSPEGFCNPLR